MLIRFSTLKIDNSSVIYLSAQSFSTCSKILHNLVIFSKMISKFSDLNEQILVRYFNCFRKISIDYNLQGRNRMRYIRCIRDYIKYSGVVYTLETFNRYLLESSEIFTLRKFGQFANFPAF